MSTEAEQMTVGTALLIVASIIGLIIIGPFVTIWAINTLFPLAAIPYTWPTWLAMAWLHLTLFGKTVRSIK